MQQEKNKKANHHFRTLKETNDNTIMKISSSVLLLLRFAAVIPSNAITEVGSEMRPDPQHEKEMMVTVAATTADPQPEQAQQREDVWKNNATTGFSVVVREEVKEKEQSDRSTCMDSETGEQQDLMHISAEASYHHVTNSPGTTTTALEAANAEDNPSPPQTTDEQQEVKEFFQVADVYGSDLGIKQTIDVDASEAPLVQRRIQEARTYVETVVNQDPAYISVRASCKNQDELCAFWAVRGRYLLKWLFCALYLSPFFSVPTVAHFLLFWHSWFRRMRQKSGLYEASLRSGLSQLRSTRRFYALPPGSQCHRCVRSSR